jgi:hypothetical protein
MCVYILHVACILQKAAEQPAVSYCKVDCSVKKSLTPCQLGLLNERMLRRHACYKQLNCSRLNLVSINYVDII